jgi:hypothetical protein
VHAVGIADRQSLENVRLMFEMLGVWWGVGWVLLWLGYALSLPLLLILVHGQIFRAAKRRRTQRITATSDGICFEDSRRRSIAAWRDVTDYYIEQDRIGCRFVVETVAGSFDFLHTLQDSLVLREIIQRHATNAPASKWQTRSEASQEVLGGEAARWTGGVARVGQRIFHFRTRTNRALMWFPTALLLIFLLLPLISAEHRRPDTMNMAFITGLLTLWGWWRFLKAGVIIDETGITQQNAFGRRFLAWHDITEYSQVGGDMLQFVRLRGEKTRLLIWFGIADCEALKSEIQRRAVNSRIREWNET